MRIIVIAAIAFTAFSAQGEHSIEQLPACRASSVFCSDTREAVPPMWNVRIVSCVPGSPIDWAAMTPTASPSSIGLPVASERP